MVAEFYDRKRARKSEDGDDKAALGGTSKKVNALAPSGSGDKKGAAEDVVTKSAPVGIPKKRGEGCARKR